MIACPLHLLRHVKQPADKAVMMNVLYHSAIASHQVIPFSPGVGILKRQFRKNP